MYKLGKKSPKNKTWPKFSTTPPPPHSNTIREFLTSPEMLGLKKKHTILR